MDTNDETKFPAHTIAVYSSGAIAGDKEWPQIARVIGEALADANLGLICVALGGDLCVELVKGTMAAGGQLRVVSDLEIDIGPFGPGVEIDIVADDVERAHLIGDAADAFVGLPCGLRAARDLYGAWDLAGGGSSGKPVSLLNRNRSFEVLRGYTQDVLGHSLANIEKLMVFAETPDDLVTKLCWQLAGH